ncbi:MAG: hypothetical protein MPN21_05170 [Thermoanaerobaculia bacterium]|nr:hypothetical protein [Thermoanaerobaculia bacterium]
MSSPPLHRPPSPLLRHLGRGLLLLALGLGFVSATQAEEVRRVEQSYFAGDAERVKVRLTFGSLEVIGTTDRDAQVELIIDCRREDLDKCRRRAERIRLQPRISRGTLHLNLKNTPRGQAQGLGATMKVRIPRHLGLEIDVSGGDVSVHGMTSHLEIDTGGGDIEATFPQDQVEYVKIDVGFGSADLWTKDGNRIEGSGFPKSITWRGTGTARVEVDLGGGEAEIRLQ